MIEKYIERMSIYDFEKLCMKKDIYLSREELQFSYSFIKEHYKDILNNGKLDITPYESKFTKEHYQQIQNLIKEYQDKINKYLKK